MKLKDYKADFIATLTPLYDAAEAARFFTIALEKLKGWGRADLAINPDAVITPAEVKEWDKVVKDLAEYRPIQYIFGEAYFYGLTIKVDENTLIPRPETEELAEWVISENKSKGKLNILDVGTGSGCIAVVLAKNIPDAVVHAIDVSPGALAVAKQNAAANNTNITFWEQDIVTTTRLPQQFDIIVSNPPYVRELEKVEIKSNVLDYEPHLALFVADNDPLLFYRKIALLAQKSLIDGGALYFEINQYLGNETVIMLQEFNYREVTLKKDIFGNDRMVKAIK